MHTFDVPLKHIYKTKWLHNETAIEGEMLSKYITACEKHSQKAEEKTMPSGTKTSIERFLAETARTVPEYIKYVVI